ncbi:MULTISPECIES: MFS transporter [unclassified Bartonella]|uniref:MFS transporter n=1 Tax=unclassified Bartonella TaxID=2645622 RepID=UPI00300DC968
MSTSSEKQDISKQNSHHRILFASLIGPIIEYFDFYVFGTAAALIFPYLFFPAQDDTLTILQSFLIFGVAFFSRPFGSVIFGHFGDKIGRKATLIAALLTMGISTIVIGILPTYETAGWWAPFLLTICRIGQGMGLGGESGGAVLLATESAPPEKRSWYAMFPQLGVSIGLLLSIIVYLCLFHFLNHDELLAWGWRIPFIFSVVLMIVGLWVRLSINETVEFKKTLERKERVSLPIMNVFFKCPRILFLGTFAGMTIFVLFYLITVYALSYSEKHLQLSSTQTLTVEGVGAVFCIFFTIITGKIANYIKRRTLIICATIIIGIYSFAIPYFLSSGIIGIFAMSIIGLSLMGIVYSQLGIVLASPYPTEIRYTGSCVTFNLSGIVGGALAPYIAEYLVQHFDISYIGYYLLLSSFISLVCFIGFRDDEISN